MAAPTGWLGRLTRGAGGARAAPPAAEEASTSAPTPAPAAAPSPGTQAKAEATKKYIENMYRERDKAAVQRMERRRSLEKADKAAVRCFGSRAPALAAPCAPRAHPASPRGS